MSVYVGIDVHRKRSQVAVVSEDGTWSAHFEHTVAITEAGPWVLTAEDGGRGGFERLHAASAPADDPPQVSARAGSAS